MKIEIYIGYSAIKDHATDHFGKPICGSTAHIVSRLLMNGYNADSVTCRKCRAKMRRLGITETTPIPLDPAPAPQ